MAQINGAPAIVHGAGRTDAGVHALGQVAHVDLERPWDVFKLRNALNANVRPHPVSVLAISEVGEDFHARFSATRRHYLYRILNRRSPPALDRGKVWWLPVDLDAEAMHEAAQHLVGKHDFSTFRAAQCQAQFAGQDARPPRRRPLRRADRDCAAMPAPSCTIRCARWWARSALWAKASGRAQDLKRALDAARPRRLRPGLAAGRALSAQG